MPWVFPSRGRQKLCQQVLDACKETGMSTPGYLFIDARVDPYDGLRVPDNWKVIRLDHEHHIWDCFHLVYQLEPNADWYGFMTDDIRPKTKDWDKILIHYARPFYLVDCNDEWLANDPTIALYSLCGNVFVWGGDLIRAVGWWRVPGIHSGVGQDDAWVHLLCKVVPDLHLRRLVKTVVIEHLQYKNKKREFDESDSHTRDGVDYYERDWKLFYAWRDDEEEINRIAGRIRAMVEEQRRHEADSYLVSDSKIHIFRLQGI